MLLTLFVAAASAKTLTVDPAGGAGKYTTISKAVTAASSGDTISVANGTYTESVDTGGKNLTIQSSGGSGKAVIDGTGQTHCVVVDGGETVTLKGFTLQNASGGIQVRGSTVTASDIVVKSMDGGSPGGGFLIADGATFTVDSCSVTGITVLNNAYGGAFHIADSTATISNCTITGNSSYQGGGAYVTASTVTMTDTTFSSNSADHNGGGLQVRNGSTFTGTRVEVSSNTASDNGGGFSLENSDLSCQNCTIDGNSSDSSGGGFYIAGDGTQTVSLTGTSTSVINNSSGGAGGAFYSWGANLQVKGTMTDNLAGAGADGGGIYFGDGALTLTDLDVSGHAASEGGAVYVAGASGETLTITNGTFDANSADKNGGAVHSLAPVTISGTTFSNNYATLDGGALYVNDDSATIADATFSGNEAGDEGGAMKIYKGALTLKRSAFAGNTAATGGAIRFHGVSDADADATINKCTFDRNTATSKGGAAAVDGADNWASYNSTYTSSSPQAVYVTGTDSYRTRDESYYGNDGDGVLLEAVTGGKVERTKFLGNAGVGLTLKGSSGLTITNAVFIGNDQEGLLLNAATDNTVQNCDAAGNNVGFSVQYGSGNTLVNLIAAANTELGIEAVSSSPAVSYSDAWDNGTDTKGFTAGTGMISSDPLYTSWSDDGNANNDILFLGSGSPCRDTGDTSLKDTDGSRSDMGSFGGAGALDTDSDKDGYKPSTGDCDESDATINPGAADTWYDGIDSDCDGSDDYDKDLDGYAHSSAGTADADCNDEDPAINPAATEILDNEVDEDCDGLANTTPVDTGGDDTGADSSVDDTGPVDTSDDWWTDEDGDGLSNSQGDCDDRNASISPAASEVCDNAFDDDCDELVDEDDGECLAPGPCGCAAGGLTPALVAALAGLAALRRRS